MSRCRNCGILNHQTQHCPRYGPWYPEPGKTREDYAALAERIVTLVAGDILAEHEGSEGHEHPEEMEAKSRGGRPKGKSLSDQDAEALARPCPNPNCLAPSGQWCTTQTGRGAERLHKVRYAKEEEHGHVQPAESAAP